MFFAGFFVGVVFVVIVEATTYLLVRTNRSAIRRVITKTEAFVPRERMAVIHRKSPQEEGMEALLKQNVQRGGITEHELKNKL